jgi:hypothetical protein
MKLTPRKLGFTSGARGYPCAIRRHIFAKVLSCAHLTGAHKYLSLFVFTEISLKLTPIKMGFTSGARGYPCAIRRHRSCESSLV